MKQQQRYLETLPLKSKRIWKCQEPPGETELTAEELEDYLIDVGVLDAESLLEYYRRITRSMRTAM